MRACSALIKACLLALAALLPATAAADGAYSLLMDVRGRELTAVCYIVQTADGRTAGTVVTEMGVKVFDFTFDGGRARVLNVMKPIDRWYIRRVLRGDFGFLLSHIDDGGTVDHRRRRLERLPGGELRLTNRRFRVSYLLTPLANDDDTDE